MKIRPVRPDLLMMVAHQPGRLHVFLAAAPGVNHQDPDLDQQKESTKSHMASWCFPEGKEAKNLDMPLYDSLTLLDEL
jgi:hypothetical protein